MNEWSDRYKNYRVWGIDYGTTNIALARLSDEEPISIFYKLDNKSPGAHLHGYLDRIVSNLPLAGPGDYQNEVDIFFIEKAIMSPSPKTFARMVRVWHSLEIIFSYMGIESRSIDNNTWKSMLLGTSRVKKEEANEWAMETWPFLERYKKSEVSHRADSLCIALAGKEILEGNAIEKCRRVGSQQSP